MAGDVPIAIILMMGCVVINTFAIYALLQVRRRNRLPRSEKSMLFAVAACGIGAGIFCNLPTFLLTADDANKVRLK